MFSWLNRILEWLRNLPATSTDCTPDDRRQTLQILKAGVKELYRYAEKRDFPDGFFDCLISKIIISTTDAIGRDASMIDRIQANPKKFFANSIQKALQKCGKEFGARS